MGSTSDAGEPYSSGARRRTAPRSLRSFDPSRPRAGSPVVTWPPGPPSPGTSARVWPTSQRRREAPDMSALTVATTRPAVARVRPRTTARTSSGHQVPDEWTSTAPEDPPSITASAVGIRCAVDRSCRKATRGQITGRTPRERATLRAVDDRERLPPSTSSTRGRATVHRRARGANPVSNPATSWATTVPSKNRGFASAHEPSRVLEHEAPEIVVVYQAVLDELVRLG